MGEADLHHAPRRIRPPGPHQALGEVEIGGEVAEEVEGERRRPQQVRPEPLPVDALIRLDHRDPLVHGCERGGSEKVRAGVARVVER